MAVISVAARSALTARVTSIVQWDSSRTYMAALSANAEVGEQIAFTWCIELLLHWS